MKTATQIPNPNESYFGGDARLYKLSEPVEYTTLNYESRKYETLDTSHVIVSAVNALYTGPETYIFPANENGKLIDWMELPGSFRGDQDHHRALAGLGYSA